MTNLCAHLSMGRSGTMWFSQLYDMADNINGVHERQQDDQLLHGINSPDLSHLDLKYWKEIAKAESGDNEFYIDVNCRLRYHINEFYNDPEVNVVSHIRHGVKVVSSYMDRANPYIFPHWTAEAKPQRISLEDWLDFSRFKRICIAWDHGNRFIKDVYGEQPKLSKINKSFDYFMEHICEPLGIDDFDKSHWETKRNAPTHSGSRNMSREYENWSDEQQETFDKYCGDLMEEYGFDYK